MNISESPRSASPQGPAAARPMPGPAAAALQRAGLALRRHRAGVAAIQWGMVALYLALLFVPALLPQPQQDARLLDHFALFAQFLLWGLWWPLVILSVLLLGRVWCGLLCPEGTLTEWASRRGLGHAIPPWLRWGGWPLGTFSAVTLYGQLSDVYASPLAAAALLGGSTTLAILVGLLYGRGKRVWCRYLCPVSGVFGLLAKLSPIHFRIDPDAWDSAPRGQRSSGKNLVNCAPLLDIRRLQSASDCNMCGRCAGERGAVQLAARSPNAEILSVAAEAATEIWPARLLVFGMLGMATATFHWQQSPWLDMLSRDGMLLAAYLGATTLLVGGWLQLWLQLGARALGRPWFSLAPALIPFAGASLFAGLSLLTTGQLARSDMQLPWADWLRAGLLASGALWSLWLAQQLASRFSSVACVGAGLALPLAAWWELLNLSLPAG